MAASMCSCTRRLVFNNIRTCLSLRCSQSTSVVEKESRQKGREEIVIPKKIKRTSLSILEALASTVEKDPTAPRYKYHDDPFLIPASNIAKKSFALSRASGKKAAQFIVNKYPKHFNYLASDPHIEALMPQRMWFRHKEVSEEALVERIDKRRVQEAVKVYKAMKEEGKAVSAATHLSLLDLLCVYNSQDPPEAMLQDEYFYRKDLGIERRKLYSRTWSDDDAAEQIFEDLAEKTPAAYCSLIRGLAKFLQCDKAFDYYQKMKDEGMPVDLSTYNALLYCANFARDTYDSKWQLVTDLLKDMEKSGTSPDLCTFNKALFTLSRMSNYRKTPAYAMQTLAEMRECQIEPSLATWKYVVNIVYNHEEVDSPILNEIIDHLEGREFTLQDLDDFEFFTNAMAKCYINLKDVELAKKIDAIVNKGQNSVLLGDGHNEGIYFSFFFRLLCMFEDMDTIMEYYERIVPNMWTPSYVGMDELLKAVELNDGFHHLPQIWSDLLMFDYIRRPELLGPLLSLMAKKQHKPPLSDKFCEIAKYLVNRWTEDFDMKTMRALELTAGMMGDLMMMSLHAGDFSQAWSCFETYKTHHRLFSGFPSEDSLCLLVDGCIQEANTERAITVLSMMYEQACPRAEEVTSKVKTQMDLSDLQLQHIQVLK